MLCTCLHTYVCAHRLCTTLLHWRFLYICTSNFSFLVQILSIPADKLLYFCDCHGNYCKEVETVARYGQSQGSQVRASVWDISLDCYDRPIRDLEGEKGEGRSNGSSNWLTPLGYYSEMMIVVLRIYVTVQEHKQSFSPIVIYNFGRWRILPCCGLRTYVS